MVFENYQRPLTPVEMANDYPVAAATVEMFCAYRYIHLSGLHRFQTSLRRLRISLTRDADVKTPA